MKKNIKRWITTLLTMMIVLSSLCVVFADTVITPKMQKAQDKFKGIASNVTGLVLFVGYGFAIGMLIYLGIKYVSSSANEKADVKKGAINYIIGAIIIVSATSLFGLLNNFGKEITAGGGAGTGDGAGSFNIQIEENMRYV